MVAREGARATLTSVAEAAGVSRQTVSNAINAPERLNPRTLQRVREVIASTGYRPDVTARQLRTRRSDLIGFRLREDSDDADGPVADRFLHALTSRAQSQGVRIALFTAHDDAEEIEAYSELRAALGVEAFVLTGLRPADPRVRWLTEQALPFVTLSRPWPEDQDPDRAPHGWVDVDGVAGGLAAVRHLARGGRRMIGFVGRPPGSGARAECRRGWARGVAEIGADPELSVQVDDGMSDGHRGLRELWDRSGGRLDAVVCDSDVLAAGAWQAVLEIEGLPGAAGGGRRRGPVVAVTGFGDRPMATAIGLTSLATPMEEAAAGVVDRLRARLTAGWSPDPQADHLLLAPILVVRASSLPR